VFDVVEAAIDAEAVRRAVAEPSARAAGAVVVFHGTVRERTGARRVLFLEYEAYRPMAVATLESVAREVATAHGLLGIACVHRVGRLDPGEVAVVVAAAAPHRAAALAGVEAFVSRMKRDVPIWKKEHFEDGSVWVGSAGGEAARA
jgi:molybdopterin synthase catalytic subunit